MAAAETVSNQELIKRFWGFPSLGQGFLGAWLWQGWVWGSSGFPHCPGPASSAVREVAGPASRKVLGAGLPSKAVPDQWDREPHRG